MFGIRGRANRKEYIVRFFLFIPVAFPCFMLIKLVVTIIDVWLGLLFTPMHVFGMIVIALYRVQSFFVTHRRLHDMNASGWWQLLGFIPFCSLVMIIICTFVKGTKGPNRFADEPQTP